MSQMAFMVVANNIHHGVVDRFGPFPGLPSFTYNRLRAAAYNQPPADQIFVYVSNDTEPTSEGWLDPDTGVVIHEGWRRCAPIDGNPYTYPITVGPFYTDLHIEFGSVPDGHAFRLNGVIWATEQYHVTPFANPTTTEEVQGRNHI